MRLTPARRLALLMHEAVVGTGGKMGFGLLRYSDAQIACVIDRQTAGQDLAALTAIPRNVPIVASVAEALALRADTLVPAIAPAGGILPPEWRQEVIQGLRGGMSLVNGLHERMADAPDFRAALTPNAWIWDVRQEPAGLENGLGRARELSAKRILTVGTDMAIGKMTASLELHQAAQRQNIPSAFVATGQIGICISGAGIALDAVRVDFASGGVEWAVRSALIPQPLLPKSFVPQARVPSGWGEGEPEPTPFSPLPERPRDEDVGRGVDEGRGRGEGLIWIEGQGSILHPASTAWLPLIRGSVPTHLILCHRAGQESIARAPWVAIPPLKEVAALYEAICAPILPAPVVGIALNCGHLSDEEAREACEQIEAETGLPTADVVRSGGEKLLRAVLSGYNNRDENTGNG